MSGQPQPGQGLYMDPASLEQDNPWDPSFSDETYSFSNSLTFAGPFSTSNPSGSNINSLDHSSTIDPSVIGGFQHRRHSQSATASFSSPTDRRRPDPPSHPQTLSKVGHGSSVPANAPWTHFAIGSDPMISHTNQRPSTKQASSNNIHTDSGYAPSVRSNQQLVSPLHMASSKHTLQPFTHEARESYIQHVLPEHTSTSLRRASSVRSQAASSVVQTDEVLEPDNLHCTVCDLPFSTKSEYTKHMARHDRKFKCTVVECKKTDGFATQNDLDRHLRSVHNHLDPETAVWRCFVDGCKSSEKIWPRQDNFRAHIDRMHKDFDIDEYVQISDHWLENTEKPRRRAQADPNTNSSARSASYTTFAGNSAATSLNNQSRSQYSMGPGEFASNVNSYSALDSASVATSQHGMQSPLNARQSISGLNSYLGPPDMMRTISNRVNTSASAMTPTASHYSLGGPSIPIIHTEDTSQGFFGDGYISQQYRGWDSKTMPEMRHPSDSFMNTWSPISGGDKTSIDDNIGFPQTDSNILAFMDPTVVDPPSMTTAENMSQEMANFPNQAWSVQTSSRLLDIDVHIEELRRKVADAVSSIEGIDMELIEKLARVVGEHASSRANTATNNSSTTGDASSNIESQVMKDERRFPCEWKDCNKSFSKKNVCVKHLKRHMRRWFCTFDGCYKHFGSKQDMQRHELTCTTQEAGWRCWCKQGSRAFNKDCSKFFTDKQSFERHCKDEHRGYTRRSMDEFKVERSFAGAFWCGFCNAVQENPILGGTDGTPRMKFRYDHIDKHLNANKTMSDWYDLKGDGRTKAESQKMTTALTNEDDEEEDDEAEDDDINVVSHPTTSSSSSIFGRRRAETGPIARRPQHLAPPLNRPGMAIKRTFPHVFEQRNDSQANKMPRTQKNYAVYMTNLMPRQ